MLPSAQFLRTAALLILAVMGPPSLWWTGVRLARALEGGTRTPPSHEQLSDYLTRDSEISTPQLREHVVWTRQSRMKVLRIAHDEAVLASATEIVDLDLKTSSARADVGRDQLAALGIDDISSIALAETPGQVWVYNWDSGRMTLLKLNSVPTVLRVVTVMPSLRSLHWNAGHLFVSGGSDTALVTVFDEPIAATSPGSVVKLNQIAVIGTPLFPGLTPVLSRSLNVTTLAQRPDGPELAAAFQWSNKIDVFDTDSMRLVRSISGPVESKLDFDIAKLAGKPLFTLNDRSMFSYTSVAGSRDTIVGLYSGRLRARYRGRMAAGDELHVFGWDGRACGAWRLHDQIDQIAFDEDRDVLYGLRNAEGASLVALDFSDASFCNKPTDGKSNTGLRRKSKGDQQARPTDSRSGPAAKAFPRPTTTSG